MSEYIKEMYFVSLTEKAIEYFRLIEEDKAKATEYYYQQLIDPVSEQFKEKVDRLIEKGDLKKYKYLIMSVGFSPEPLILWIRAFKPEKVFFLTTSNTISKLDQIATCCNLRYDQVKYYELNSTDSVEVYRQIKNIIEIDRLKYDLNVTAIDITGGKKSMVSGCTLAANYLGLDALYVDYDTYNPEFRKPQPGTELPTILRDPLEVFGDRELDRGKAKFNSGDFDRAMEIFSNIKERVANPREYEMFEYLSNGYMDLEAMCFDSSYENINKALDICGLIRSEKIPYGVLKNQLDVLEPLKNFPYNKEEKVLADPKLFWHIYGLIFFLAKHRMEQKKLDHAALLIYRLLEMSVQYLLFTYGIQASKASFDHLEIRKEELLEKVNSVGRELYGASTYLAYSKFPKHVTLMFGLQVLKALDDPIVKKLKLLKLKDSSEVRNRSILAHGFQTISFEDVDPFYKTVINQISEQMWKDAREELGYENKYKRFQDFMSSFKFVTL